MPSGDRTGPLGQGPMTGRRMGFCAGFNNPGFMNSGFGRGFGRGSGRGFGRGRGPRNAFVSQAQAMPMQVAQPVQTITESQEKELLEADLKDLKAEMKEIEKRLKELNA